MEGCKESRNPRNGTIWKPTYSCGCVRELGWGGRGGGGVGKMCWELLPAGFALGCGALSMAGAVEFIIL